MTFENCQPKDSGSFEKSQPKPIRCGCGGEVKVDEWIDVCEVRCPYCGISIRRIFKAEAIEAWNRAMGATDTNVGDKYEYHIDHTDCIWYWNGKGKCPSTCSQYRDGWNDAMNYVYKDGKGYNPYRRSEK